MDVSYDFSGQTVVVTGAGGALGSTIATSFREAGATVSAVDIVTEAEANLDIDHQRFAYFQGDLSDEPDVERVIENVVDEFGQIDALCNIAGTWRGGSPIDATDVDTFDLLFDVNLKTMFLASKHALPHLRETAGAIVSVSARSSLEGGEGDGPYRASKAGVRLLTETIAEENLGEVRANAIMPSVIDTPMNREMMPDADHSTWVDPEAIARVVMFLCADESAVTSGGAVPVYGEA